MNTDYKLEDLLLRIIELKNEYYNLEIEWKRNKTFSALDRKKVIETVFKELNRDLEDWGSYPAKN